MSPEELKDRFAQVQTKINKMLTATFYSKKTDAQIRAIINKDLERLIAFLQEGTDTFLEQKVVEEFTKGIDDTAKQLLAAKFLESSAIQLTYATNLKVAPPIMRERVQEIMQTYKGSFSDSFRATRQSTKQAVRKVLDLRRSLNQAVDILDLKTRNEAVELARANALKGVFTGQSIDEITEKTTKELKKLIGKDSGIMFRDRAGQKWSFERYSELMTRDISAAAYREGQVETFLDVGLDIVTTTKTGTTDSCLVWEDKLFSLTGATKGLPTYNQIRNDDTHMFVYGCRHQIRYLSEEEIVARIRA